MKLIRAECLLYFRKRRAVNNRVKQMIVFSKLPRIFKHLWDKIELQLFFKTRRFQAMFIRQKFYRNTYLKFMRKKGKTTDMRTQIIAADAFTMIGLLTI